MAGVCRGELPPNDAVSFLFLVSPEGSREVFMNNLGLCHTTLETWVRKCADGFGSHSNILRSSSIQTVLTWYIHAGIR